MHLFIKNTIINRLYLFIFLLFFCSLKTEAQSYQWAHNIGGGGSDVPYNIFADNNGFVYVVGSFAGSNVDFDPSPNGVAYLSSNGGSQDGFVAKYTAIGQYVWAFNFGGTNLDEAASATVDKQGNVYITGYFRGQGVDFDPSVTGTALLNSNGEGGGDPGFGGDIFVAKYNSNGQYIWAFNTGGTTLGDNGIVIASDAAANIYVTGYFRENIDFDPSPGSVHNLDAATGTIFVAKYNTNGNYLWAFNLGEGNFDNTSFGMKLDASANIYLTGFFQGSNIDFNPSPTVTNALSSNGDYDIFVAKYTTDGQYDWAFNIGGFNTDIGRDICVDPSGNVYVAGSFNGANIDFDPSPGGSAYLTSNAADVFVAKYNSSGQYQWAHSYGSSGDDVAYGLAFANNNLYVSGGFYGTMNFNPGGTDNLVSNGGKDAYMSKFDANGNYKCAFSIGGQNDEDGYRIVADQSGNIIISGILSSSNVDFNPTSANNYLSSNGGNDIYFGKYNWPDNTSPTGIISGNAVCGGRQAQLTFTATNGVGPFTLVYSDGVTNYTQDSVVSGVPFNPNVPPLVTTTYSLVSIKDGTRCSPQNNVNGIKATITVTGSITPADFSFAIDTCNPLQITLATTSTDFDSIKWTLGNGTTIRNLSNPSYTYSSYGNYTIQMIRMKGGCTDTTSKTIAVNVTPADIITTKDTIVCLGTTVALHTKPAQSFCWSPVTYLDDPGSANPKLTPTSANLIVNGDFSAGNTGFTSAYNYTVTNQNAGEYFIGPDPKAWYINFDACKDHTSGTGNMMLINGANQANVNVWKQTVTVQPNTNYNFSAWVEGLYFKNPAQLQFSINGILIGNTFTASSTSCLWQQFATGWNSGSNTSAVISIVNQNTAFSGNDFALDDIFFGKVTTERDSVTIRVNNCTALAQPSFTAPDTVCVNTPLNIKNTSKAATSYYWSFCSPSTSAMPAQFNLYNNGSSLNSPVASDLAKDANGLYHAFILDYFAGTVLRLDFGNSVQNTPVTTTVASLGNVYPKGIQLAYANGRWMAIVIAGGEGTDPVSNILKLDFGASITNASPVVTDMGNPGGLLKGPYNLSLFTDAGHWYAFISNVADTRIVLVDFGTAFGSVTVAANILMNMQYAFDRLRQVNVNGNWYLFGLNTVNNQLLRLDFGNSLFNTPIYNTVGNPGNAFSFPAGISFVRECGNVIGFVTNQLTNDLVKIDFKNSITSLPSGVSLGNITGMQNASSLSKIYKEGTSLYGITTSLNNAVTKLLYFPGCTSASQPASTAQNPAAISYNAPGIYTVNLAIDEGLPTEDSYCKQVVVLPKPNKIPTLDTSFCSGDSVLLHASAQATSYTWSTGSTDSAIYVHNTGVYWVDAGFNGCTVRDSTNATAKPLPAADAGTDAAICLKDSVQLVAAGGSSYQWFPLTGLSNSAIANPVASPAANTKYFVKVTGANGCSATDSVSVNVKPLPLAKAGNDAAVCSADSTQLNASANGTVQWLPSIGLSAVNIPNPKAAPLVNTTYYLQVTGANGCVETDSLLVVVNAKPTIHVRTDTAVCAATPVQLTTQVTGANIFSWSPSAGLDNPTSQIPTALPSDTTRYVLTASSVDGCSSTAGVNIYVLPSPIVRVSNDTTICVPGSAQLLANGGQSYNWSPSTGLSSSTVSNPTATPASTTTYSVKATGNNGCSQTASVLVSVQPKPVFTIDPPTVSVCVGQPLTITASGGDSYLWSTQAVSSSIQVQPSINQTYTVQIINSACKQADTLSSVVSIVDAPVVTISKSNDIDCVTGQAKLTATGGNRYLWYPSTGVSDVNAVNPVVTPSQTTVYHVQVFNSNGCVKEDSVEVKVSTANASNGYLLSSAFTPNGDGLNDCFGVKHWGLVSELDLTVFDRWGVRVFHSSATGNCWNGTYKGQPQPTGTYVYQVKAKSLCGNIYRKGTVVLIR